MVVDQLSLQAGRVTVFQDLDDTTAFTVEVTKDGTAQDLSSSTWADPDGLMTVDDSDAANGKLGLSCGTQTGNQDWRLQADGDTTYLQGTLVVGSTRHVGAGTGTVSVAVEDQTVTVSAVTANHDHNGAYVAKTDVAAPVQAIPSVSLLVDAAPAAWVAADRAQFVRLPILRTHTYRYIRMSIGTASGNIQVGVVRIDSYRSNGTPDTYTRVMDSGVIASPTAATIIRVDLGATELPPGDYMLFCWADNTTVTIPWDTSDRSQAMTQGHYKTSLASGVPATGSFQTGTPSSVTLSGFLLEGDI